MSGEATITVVLFSLLSKEALARALDWNALLALAPALAVALLVTPLACSHPDGLEWVARSCGFLRETRPLGLLADYAVPFVEEEFASVALAATFGVFVFVRRAIALLPRNRTHAEMAEVAAPGGKIPCVRRVAGRTP